MIKQWYVRKNGKFIRWRKDISKAGTDTSHFPFTAMGLSKQASELYAEDTDTVKSPLAGMEPTEQEANQVLAELNDAIVTAERIVRRMDTTHALLQDCVREVREAREILVESNRQAKVRAGESAL